MAMNWTEAQIEEVVASVLKNLQKEAPAVKSAYDGSQYGGKTYVGVYTDMNDAIDAATAGYKAVRAMRLEEREKIISAIRDLTRAEAPVMARLGVSETKMGKVEHKIAKHVLVADKTPGTADVVSAVKTGDYGLTLTEMAPFGVVGSITPSTNPSETVICNSIGMIAAGNGVVFNPHPNAIATSNYAVDLVNRASAMAGGPKVLVASVVKPTLETAQIMYKHQYPVQGKGSHSYKTNSYKLSLSADFGATAYDWVNMLPDYTGAYSEEQATAVATLMSHVGIAVDMDYTPNFSGAIAINALKALHTYFDYDANISILPKNYMDEIDILWQIADDLEAGRPVFMEGSTINGEGHAFLCDGMDEDGFLHINWGWDGISNGYYAFSALDPDVQGTGGSSSNLAFTKGVSAYTGVQPNQGGVGSPLISVAAIERTSQDEIGRNERVKFELSGFMSRGIVDAAGVLMYRICDSNNAVVSEVEIQEFELASGYFYASPVPLSHAIPKELPAGEYT